MSLRQLRSEPYPGLRQSAFTLIEMLLVIILLAVVAGLTVPSFRKSFSGIELKNQSQEFVYLMRYGQSRSVTKGTRIRMNLELGSRNYFLTESEEESERLDFKPIKGKMGRKYQFSSKIDIESKETTIDFFSDGTIEKVQIRLCLERNCVVISTLEQRGKIKYYNSVK